MTPPRPRPAAATEAADVAALLRASRVAVIPAIPPPVHDPSEDLLWAETILLVQHDVWVLDDAGGGLLAVLALSPGWVDQLFVAPGRTGEGLGSVLLDHAKQLHPSGLQLWTFETNLGARRFYARHGFTEVERTDGSGNEEKAPDVRMVWSGVDGG